MRIIETLWPKQPNPSISFMATFGGPCSIYKVNISKGTHLN